MFCCETGLVARLGYVLLGVVSATATWSAMPVDGLAAYRRPSTSRTIIRQETTTSGGRGGGVSQDGLPLTLLAPKHHVGQTNSTHPTFAWFVPVERELEGAFQIYEITGAGKFHKVLDTPQILTSTQGVMSYTLPHETAGLKPGADYVWQVFFKYGPRPSQVEQVRAQIRVVDEATPVPVPLSENPLEQAEQLAEAELWYDALALLVDDPSGSQEVTALQARLLEQLANIEATDESAITDDSPIVSHSQALLEIINRLIEQ